MVLGTVLALLLPLLFLPSSPNQEISNRLTEYFNSYLDTTIITNVYQEESYRYMVDTHSLGTYVSKVTGSEFDDALEALKNIQKTGSRAYKRHKWDRNIDFHYWDGFTDPMVANNGTALNLHHSERYDSDVSMFHSAINLPLDVYDNWTEVRNTIQWTSKLDKAFIQNQKSKGDNIFWQYIGTPQGVMRTFPATYISMKDQVDFDVRRRPWYNAGIGCPKDVIMLLDTSGSLEGFPIRLLKTTAIKFLTDILSDTDFVTAIAVSETPYIMTCYTHLTRANKVVKQMMIGALEGISPNGTSNWEGAFEMAYDTFKKSEAIGQTTNCTKVIVIFSDETGQPVDEIVERLQPDAIKQRARIFVFSFRRNEGLYADRLKTVACSNRGYYSKILYFGQIEAGLQRLVQVGNSPLKDAYVAPTWSNAYVDLAGFGLVVTVTLPIVVGTSESEKVAVRSNNSVALLGIVGLDFKSSRIVQISSSVLPISSVAIIINNKGYPVYHPRIDKYKYEDVNTKLHKFQWTEENRQHLINLEWAMIDRAHTKVTFKSFLTFEHQKRGTEWYQDMHYQIFPVSNTPFSIACIYPTYPPTYLMYRENSVNIEDILSIINTWQGRFLDNFQDNSCHIRKYLERGVGSFTFDPSEDAPKTQDSSHVCEAVVYAIFTDIYFSKKYKDVFKVPARQEPREGEKFSRSEILSHFIMTYNGIVFTSNPNWAATNSTALNVLAPYSQTIKNISEATMFISQPLRRPGYNFRSVNITQRLSVNVSGSVSQVAAAGFEVRVEIVREVLLAGFKDKYERFLVDENGEVVMGYPQDVSGHLGMLYPYLFEGLVKRRIFQVVNYTECINECREAADHHDGEGSSSSSSAGPPIVRSILANTLLALINLLAHLKLLLYLNLFGGGVEGNHIVSERTVECCRMFNLYQRNFAYTDSSTYITGACTNCQSMYEVSAVPGTNLLLVVDLIPACRCYAPTTTPYKGVRVENTQNCRLEANHYKKPTDALSEHEFMEMKSDHYYRSFKTCILSDTDENMCSGAERWRANVGLVLLVCVVLRFL